MRLGFLNRFRPLDLMGCALAACYGIPSIWYPFGNDQALHWYLGDGMLRGELPYVTGVSGKPLGIFTAHAVAIALFGNTQAAIRILEIIGVVLLGALVAACAAGPGRPPRHGAVGASALLVSAVNYTYSDYWNTAHPEFWEAWLLMAAAAVAIRDTRPGRRPLVAGLLCGLAFMFKYTAAVQSLVIAGWCGLAALREAAPGTKWRGLFRAATWFLAGVLAVFVEYVFCHTRSPATWIRCGR
jgi:hypothetical protein